MTVRAVAACFLLVPRCAFADRFDDWDANRDGVYALGKHLDQSSDLVCAVDYFGPTNLPAMDDSPSKIVHGAADSPEGKLVGGALADRRRWRETPRPRLTTASATRRS
jgi:hypothetical protein